MATAELPSSAIPGQLTGAEPLDLRDHRLPPRLRPSAATGVLDITKFFGAATGGIRTYLTEKARYVASREHLRQVVVVPGDRDTLSDGAGVRWYRLKGREIPTQRPYRFLMRRAAIAQVIEHESPDIIEVGSPYLVPWLCRPIARRLQLPLIWFYHTDFPRIISPRPSQDGSVRRAAGRLAQAYVARLGKVFHGALAASNASVRALEQAGFSRIEKVPLGVDLVQFHPDRRAARPETRSRYGLPDGPVALYVGRLAREKELHLVLDAWPQVEARTGASLALVGDGPSRRFFQDRCRARRVTWLPYERDRDALADLIAAADLLIAPGPAETFGLAALEAMASGVPVFSSDQGAVRELVEASGAGAVNPAPRAEVMAEHLIRLLGENLLQLGNLGRAYAERSHDWALVFDRIFAAYQRLIEDFR